MAAKFDPKALEKAVAKQIKAAEAKLNRELARIATASAGRSQSQLRADVKAAGRRVGIDLDTKTINGLADDIQAHNRRSLRTGP